MNLPRAILIGLPLVTALYVMANISYYAVLPLDQIVNRAEGHTTNGFVSNFGSQSMGKFGEIFLPICIVISTFGAANGGVVS